MATKQDRMFNLLLSLFGFWLVFIIAVIAAIVGVGIHFIKKFW